VGDDLGGEQIDADEQQQGVDAVAEGRVQDADADIGPELVKALQPGPPAGDGAPDAVRARN